MHLRPAARLATVAAAGAVLLAACAPAGATRPAPTAEGPAWVTGTPVAMRPRTGAFRAGVAVSACATVPAGPGAVGARSAGAGALDRPPLSLDCRPTTCALPQPSLLECDRRQ